MDFIRILDGKFCTRVEEKEWPCLGANCYYLMVCLAMVHLSSSPCTQRAAAE
jgi:hypothetical protein